MNTKHARRVIAALAIATFALITPMASPPAAQAALSDCPSGYFCAWTGTNYSGTVKKINTTNAYTALNLTSVKSYYNNRSYRTWIHSTTNGSGTYSCLSPGQKSSSVTGWMASAKSVWLATITNC